MVHRVWPSGAFEQARATNWASCLPSSLREVLRVERWDKFPRREKLGAEVMKKVDDVVGKDGLVATLGREGKEVGAILVRVEAGKAKVVGVED
jgi:hypothetical protein